MSYENVEIIEVKSSADMNRFIKFPYDLYKDDPNWVPPLLSERRAFFDKGQNPFFRYSRVKYFMARKEGEIAGRIASIVNFNHNQFHEDSVGFFGFFECIEDYEVADVLFRVALIELKREGLSVMRGPTNFSTNYEIGFIVDDFDSPPVINMPYNPKYYIDFAEKFGFRKVKDLYAYKITQENEPSERIVRIVDKIREKENVKVRNINMKKFKQELKVVNKIYNNAWSKNWGFVPLPYDEFAHIARDMKEIVDPDLVFIAEVDGNPIGFSMALPNVYQVLPYANGRLFPFGALKLFWHTKIKNKIDSARILTMGIEHEYQKRGIDNIFYLETFRRGVEKGYTWAEISWVLEDNELMKRAAKLLGAERYRTYRLYDLSLGAE
ncbi:MAG: N-acetyltransferase [candidate division Zixibacteria bacterium]|nr:N-acetyltransferase [candidate division Zixibacteria bacterium]